MRFSFQLVESLPKLAWCAMVHRSNGLVHVFHGPWVETRNRFFVEGAWDGHFKEGRLGNSSLFMGSGAELIDDKILFATPSHSLEKLHFYKTEDFVYVSNSMVFLLKRAKRRLDMNYIGYEFDLDKQIQGLKHHVQYIPLDKRSKMLLCSYRNVEIDSELEFHIHHKPEPPSFPDFASYKNFLINGLLRLDENARDSVRTICYSPLTTISSGYDSCACSALALEIGCTEAVTILNARDQYNYAEDSGTLIGEIMGFKVREYEQDAYKRLPGIPEAEFVAMGGSGPDVVMAPMAEVFCQRLVITGIHGDAIWERNKNQNSSRRSRDIRRLTLHGATFSEFRLRVGFVHVPLPFFGCLNYPDIWNISNSEEMSLWSIGGNYDRPIARRLVEEKGIDRNSFGKEKLATTTSVSGATLNEMQGRMTPQSSESFARFYTEHKKNRTIWQRVKYKYIFFVYHLTRSGIFPGYILPFIKRLFPFLKFFERVRFDEESFRLHWGMSLIENRYEIKEKKS